MARSSLFASLLRVAETGRAADHLGIDGSEAMGRRAEAARSDQWLSRRRLLQAAALTAATASGAGSLVLGRRAGAAPRPGRQPRVAIVGAGISGMSAAMHLRDSGFSHVTVYEANDRIGGRTFTRRGDGFFETGQWAEWGGELIDTSHKTVLSLCRRYGFDVIDLGWHSVTTNGATDTLWFGGGYYGWDQMVTEWKASGAEQVIQKQMGILPPWPWSNTSTWTPEARAISQLTIAQWIDRYIPGGRTSRLGSFIDVAYTIEFGEDTDKQSALDLLGLLGFSNGAGTGAWWVWGKSDERWKIVGGNQQLSLAQADELGRDRIALGHRFEAARRNLDGTATLTFRTGSTSTTVVADRVIFAVPLGVMKRLAANGAFSGSGFETDPLRMGAIAALGFGADNKLQLQIADRFWCAPGPWGNTTGESFSDNGFQEAWPVHLGQPGRSGILVDYTGGSLSRQLNPAAPFTDTNDPSRTRAAFVRSSAQTFLRQIEPVFPGMTARWTGKAQLSAWHVNPDSFGAYSYWTPGYCERFCTSERLPARPFHFAGEHVSQDFQGYIEGGATEGIRAAVEIVADFA